MHCGTLGEQGTGPSMESLAIRAIPGHADKADAGTTSHAEEDIRASSMGTCRICVCRSTIPCAQKPAMPDVSRAAKGMECMDGPHSSELLKYDSGSKCIDPVDRLVYETDIYAVEVAGNTAAEGAASIVQHVTVCVVQELAKLEVMGKSVQTGASIDEVCAASHDAFEAGGGYEILEESSQ